MELQYYGANCLRLTTKKASFVIDDTLEALGGKSVAKEGDILLYTDVTCEPRKGMFCLSSPGEYEVAEVSIFGVAAQRHIDEAGTRQGVMYRIENDDLTLAVLGNIDPNLSDDQLEGLGVVDILVIPVGGHGLTVDAVGALQLIKKIEPKLVIPVHYADKGLSYPMPQATLEEALKGLAMEPSRTETRVKLKPSDLPEQTQLIVLEKQ